jgi:putative DNA-invertase from lambdoid prophage Rac
MLVFNAALSKAGADPMTATFAYLRASKNDDVETTTEQRLELEQAGFRVDHWAEETISAGTDAMGRPGFAAMLEKMRDGETLIVSKLNQLGRDSIDVIATVRMLADRDIRVIVHSLGGVDLASPTGKLLFTMLAAVAEMERDLLIERTQAGIARARSEGKAIGRPFKTTQRQRDDMLAWLAAGETVSAVARKYGISRAAVIAVRVAHRQSALAT